MAYEDLYDKFGNFKQPMGPGYVPGPRTPRIVGFWVRFAAALIDGLVIGIPFAILLYLVTDRPAGGLDTGGFGPYVDPGTSLTVSVLQLAAFALYYGLLEGGRSGQTLGKKACGIRVVDASTGRPGIGFVRAVFRYAVSLLSAAVCYVGYLWMFLNRRKQTWHDIVSGALVMSA